MTKEAMSFGVEEREIISRILTRFGNESEALDWFNSTPLPGHGSATARDLVREGRAQDVLAYIDSVDAGIHT
jgi:Protein of unknown function (DUF2384)